MIQFFLTNYNNCVIEHHYKMQFQVQKYHKNLNKYFVLSKEQCGRMNHSNFKFVYKRKLN